MPQKLTHESSILVIGAGTWGASTALHLARRGYKNVTVLDPYGYPSPIAAGNDVNKIVSAESPKEVLLRTETKDQSSLSATDILARAASIGWLQDPVFKPHYHETGYIVAASSPDGLEFVRERERDGDKSEYKELKTAEDFRGTMPKGVLTGEFKGWQGWYKATGSGWAHARNAYVAAAKEAERLGVRFTTGKPQGEVIELIHESGDVVGARTADGIEHRAVRTILAAGAYSDALLDFEKQLRPTAWTLLHIRMTDEEAKQYRNLPVLFNVESGFFLEPDADNHEVKICDEHPGYTNWVSGDSSVKKSVPFARHQVPADAERRARKFLIDTMPHLADRPFSFARICWCADTPDRMFLIDRHPKYPSLVLGAGASGHGYSHIPSVGGFIVDAMEDKLPGALKQALRWRPETAVNRDWKDTQGGFGGERRVMDFGEVKEWTDIREQAEEEWTRVSEESMEERQEPAKSVNWSCVVQ